MQGVTIDPSFSSWREQARRLLHAKIPPCDVEWRFSEEESGLFNFSELSVLQEEPAQYEASQPQYTVPKAFLHLAESVASHRSDTQWALLYDVIWRMTHGGDRALLINHTDDAVLRLHKMQKEIRRDMHKMRAFVRFKQLDDGNGEEYYVSWFEPEHRILRLNVPFFRKRFTGMRWSILTPDECAHWDGETIEFSEGLQKEEVPQSDDAFEAYWLAYYRSTFNPARLKIKMMQSEMPKKYWKNLPEAEIIQELIQGSSEQVLEMMERQASAVKPRPKVGYLEELHRLNNSAGDAPE